MNEPEFLQRIHQHQGLLHKISRMYGSSAEEQEDLMQEMLFQLWKALPSYDEQYRFSTWMYRVALNTAISSFRKSQRRPWFASLEAKVLAEPGAAASTLDDHEQLHQAIGQLSSVSKALILLHLEGQSHREIAKILDISANLVGVRLHRIRQQLKIILTQFEHES